MLKGRRNDNFTMKILLEALQRIIGSSGSSLNNAHLHKYIDTFAPDNDEPDIPLEDIHILHHSLFGLSGGDGVGLQLQIGREICWFGVERPSKILRALRLSPHLLLETQKLRFILENYVEEVNCNGYEACGDRDVLPCLMGEPMLAQEN